MFVYLEHFLLCVTGTLCWWPCGEAGFSTDGTTSRRLTYNRTELYWYDAVTSCEAHGRHLLTLDPSVTQAGLKRQMDIIEGDSAWVGAYEYFETLNISPEAIQNLTFTTNGVECGYVVINNSTHVTSGSWYYQFTVKHQSCGNGAGLVCTCNTDGTALANSRHCGFLTYCYSSVLFDDCYKRKGFACEFYTGPSTTQLPTKPTDVITDDDVTVDGMETPTGGSHVVAMYAGISGGVFLLVVVTLVGILYWRRKHREVVPSKRPQATDSSRRYVPPSTAVQSTSHAHADDTGPPDMDNRSSLYATVDTHHGMDMCVYQPGNTAQPISSIVLNDVTETDVDVYARIQSSYINDMDRPDVTQNTDYLRMDGFASGSASTCIDDGSYDLLSHMQVKELCTTYDSDNAYGFQQAVSDTESE